MAERRFGIGVSPAMAAALDEIDAKIAACNGENDRLRADLDAALKRAGAAAEELAKLGSIRDLLWRCGYVPESDDGAEPDLAGMVQLLVDNESQARRERDETIQEVKTLRAERDAARAAAGAGKEGPCPST